MAVRKTIWLDPEADFLVERAASREGISVSAWLARAVRKGAAEEGYPIDPYAYRDEIYDEIQAKTLTGEVIHQNPPAPYLIRPRQAS